MINSIQTSVVNNNAYGTLDTGSDKLLGLRFLEVVATKIFGHARARAAIENDQEFYKNTAGSLIKQISDGVQSGFNSKKSDIFNMYVSYDRIEDNKNDDVNAPSNFNFQHTSWEFPICLKSTLVGSGDMTELNLGPYVGGNRLTAGSMAVPILLRFVSSNSDTPSIPSIPSIPNAPNVLNNIEYEIIYNYDGIVECRATLHYTNGDFQHENIIGTTQINDNMINSSIPITEYSFNKHLLDSSAGQVYINGHTSFPYLIVNNDFYRLLSNDDQYIVIGADYILISSVSVVYTVSDINLSSLYCTADINYSSINVMYPSANINMPLPLIDNLNGTYSFKQVDNNNLVNYLDATSWSKTLNSNFGGVTIGDDNVNQNPNEIGLALGPN
jgi:hypothetical protein